MVVLSIVTATTELGEFVWRKETQEVRPAIVVSFGA